MPLLETPEIEVIEEAPLQNLESPVIFYSEKPEKEDVVSLHQLDSDVEDPEVDVILQIKGLPGVDKLDPELEKNLEINEDEIEEISKADDSKKNKKIKWDWESKGLSNFVDWIKERLNDIPKHSGYDSSGIERTISYMEKIDSEISKAMRMDLDGELDSNKIEEIRSEIEEGIERLNERLNKINKNKKKKKANNSYELIVKEAQKSTPIGGIVITVPLLISRIARVCINGAVSAGHDLEDLFLRQAKKYKLTDREKAECVQLMMDMGYPIRQDRGYLIGEDVDTASQDNFDWAANYQG